MKESRLPNYIKATLVTGGSSGIGLAFTEDLLLGGKEWGEYEVVVVAARNSKKLKDVISQIQNKLDKKHEKSTLKIIPLVIDISQPGAVSKVMDFIKRHRLHITTLINNAGIGYMGKFITMPEDKFKEIITLNITAVTGLSHAILNHIQSYTDNYVDDYNERPQSNPIIINVASVVGLIPSPLSTVYAASKAYVVSFSEALRAECQEEIRRQGYGVEVYTLCPGSTRTAFFERAGKGQRRLLATDHFMSPSQVVKETRQAIAHKQGFIIPGTANRFIPILGRVLPRRMTTWIAHSFMKKRLK